MVPNSKALMDFQNMLQEFEPLETLAHLALDAYFTNPEHLDGNEEKYAVLEMIAAFYSSWPIKNGIRRPKLDNLQKIMEKGSEIIDNYFSETLQNNRKSNESLKEDSVSVQSKLHFLFVRHEGYPNQLWKVSEEEFSPHDAFLRTRLGFDIHSAIEIFKHIYYKIEEQGKQHLNAFPTIVTELLHTWNHSNGEKLEAKDPFEKAKEYRKSNPYSSLDEYNEKAKDVFTLEIRDLNDKFGSEMMTNFLKRFAGRFGEINTSYKEPLDFDELNSRPILLLPDNKIFVPVLPMLAEVPIRTLHYDLIKDAAYEPTYSEKKSDYYENKTIQYLSRIFGAVNVHPNLRYGAKNEFETDVLVHFDDRILIVECKSKTLTLPAKQGSFASIMKDFEKAIQTSYDQAKRTREYILENESAKFRDTRGKTIEIRRNSIEKIYHICVTADSFAGLSSDLTSLLRKEANDEFPWAVSILDLELTSEYLGNPYYFLHFLGKRIKYHGKVFSPDEMDYVGCYLLQGLHFDEEVKKYVMTFIIGFTEQFDHDQFKKMGHNISAKVGNSWSNPSFNNLIGTLASLKDQKHTTMIEMLLNLSSKSRDELIEAIEFTINRTLEDKKHHDVTLLFEDYGISFTSKVGRLGLRDMVIGQSIMKKYKHKKNKWLGLGRDTSDTDYLVNEHVYIQKEWEFDGELEKLSKSLGGHRP